MAVRTVQTDAEQAKRNAVKALARAGKAGYADATTSTKPNTDLAAAGAATVAGDPVDLGAAAQATASAISAAPSADANRYAEATRVIFENQAKSRGATSMRRLGDEWGTQVDAANYELAEYDRKLAEQAASGRRGGGGGYRYGGGGGTDLDPLADPANPDGGGGGDWVPPENFTPWDEDNYVESAYRLGEFAYHGEDMLNQYAAQGYSFLQARDIVYRALRDQGYDPADIWAWLRGMQAVYSPETLSKNLTEGPGGSALGTGQPNNPLTGNPSSARGNPDI